MIKRLLTLTLITSVILTSCSDITSKADDFIQDEYVETLKDPTSYVKISTEIKDTVYEFEEISSQLYYLRDIFQYDSTMLEVDKEFGYQDQSDIDVYLQRKEEIDSLESKLKNIDSTKIGHIVLEHKYKALNSSGMLSPDKIILHYSPVEFINNSNFLIVK